MGGGQRHSKNAGAMGCESQSYAEKRSLKFGTISERLGKDAIKDFDACSLTLQFAVDPMVTREGVLYSKETILENLLSQKKEISRKVKAWEAEQAELALRDKAKEEQTQQSKLAVFHAQNHAAAGDEPVVAAGTDDADVVSPTAAAAHGATSAKTTGFEADQVKNMKAFWLPSQTPTAEEHLDKPDTTTKCPITSKKLRLKDLVAVKFAAAKGGMECRYMCPTCCKGLTNSTKIVVLATGGEAMCLSCYDKFVKPDEAYNGKRVTAKDVIKLQRGGTGFVETNQVKAETRKMLGVGSGSYQVRGQSAGPASSFGLKYTS